MKKYLFISYSFLFVLFFLFYLIPDFMVIEFIELCFQFKELGNTVPGLLKVS